MQQHREEQQQGCAQPDKPVDAWGKAWGDLREEAGRQRGSEQCDDDEPAYVEMNLDACDAANGERAWRGRAASLLVRRCSDDGEVRRMPSACAHRRSCQSQRTTGGSGGGGGGGGGRLRPSAVWWGEGGEGGGR